MDANRLKHQQGSLALQPEEQPVTARQLIDFRNELLLEIKKSVREAAGHPVKRWLKTHEIRKILGVSETTLLTLRINGVLPYSKIGGCLYFDYEDLLKAMEQNKTCLKR